MPKNVTPMIHVPDVGKTVEWYKSIGFQVIDSFGCDDEINWAMLRFGDGVVMFNDGRALFQKFGRAENIDRREVDLYVTVENIDQLFESLKDRVEVRIGLNNSFYGMREFIVRDINGFWVTFGEQIKQEQS